MPPTALSKIFCVPRKSFCHINLSPHPTPLPEGEGVYGQTLGMLSRPLPPGEGSGIYPREASWPTTPFPSGRGCLWWNLGHAVAPARRESAMRDPVFMVKPWACCRALSLRERGRVFIHGRLHGPRLPFPQGEGVYGETLGMLSRPLPPGEGWGEGKQHRTPWQRRRQ